MLQAKHCMCKLFHIKSEAEFAAIGTAIAKKTSKNQSAIPTIARMVTTIPMILPACVMPRPSGSISPAVHFLQVTAPHDPCNYS